MQSGAFAASDPRISSGYVPEVGNGICKSGFSREGVRKSIAAEAACMVILEGVVGRQSQF